MTYGQNEPPNTAPRADRRLVTLTIPTSEPPHKPPEDLKEVVVALPTIGTQKVWRLNLSAVFAAGDYTAADRFSRWTKTFCTRVLLGEAWTVEVLGDALAQTQPDSLLVKSLQSSAFCALDTQQCAQLANTTIFADPIPTNPDHVGWGLVDVERDRQVPGRLWLPGSSRWVLSRAEDVTVHLDHTGLEVNDGFHSLSVSRWELDGQGLLVTSNGECEPLTGPAAALLSAQAPGTFTVRCASADSATVLTALMRRLRRAAATAVESERYLLIGTDIPRDSIHQDT